MPETETIELIQPILGMNPYVLIEAEKDPDDGELVLRARAGALPDAKDIGVLPMLLITELPAESNPLTKAIAEHLADHPDHRDALASFAEALNVPMPDGAPCGQDPCEHAPDGGNHPAVGNG